MKRPALKLTMLAIAVYLVALVMLFPASLALRWFVPPVPALSIGPANGTIWNGRVAGFEYEGWNPGAAQWSLQPLSLLGLAAAADLRIERGDAPPINATVRATPAGDLRITNLRGALTLADLEQLRVIPQGIASGELLLDLDYLEIAGGIATAADGSVALTGVQSTLLPGIPLGDYEGEVSSTDNGITATFREIEAPLRVAGQAQLQPSGEYTVSGNITPTSETPELLRRGLALLGQPDTSGRYAFSFRGRL